MIYITRIRTVPIKQCGFTATFTRLSKFEIKIIFAIFEFSEDTKKRTNFKTFGCLGTIYFNYRYVYPSTLQLAELHIPVAIMNSWSSVFSGNWFTSCYKAQPNGVYFANCRGTWASGYTYYLGMQFKSWKDTSNSAKETKLMARPSDFTSCAAGAKS